MSNQPRALAALALVAAAGPSPETQLKERDQASLGKLIAEYFEARRETSGQSEALEEIAEEIDKLEKKTKGVPVLSMVEDVQRALYFARDYKDSLPKGRLGDFEHDPAYGEAKVPYQVHAPRSYKSSKGPYPLVICLPDEGEGPEEHLDEHWVDAGLRETAILAACTMPAERELWTEARGAVGNALLLLRDVRNNYAVDLDGVYLAGRGASVETAVRAAEMYPHVFAGVIGRAGDMPPTSPTNFRNLPTFFAGGGANCTAFEEAAKAAGIENCTLSADAGESEILEWIREHPRVAHPLDVSLMPATRTTGSAYWIEARGFDPEEKPSLRAKIDRETNTVQVDATDIASVSLFFNDLLVDLDAPIHIVTNGVEHEIKLARRLEFALERAYISGDSGRLYTNYYYFDMPAGETDGESGTTESGAQQ
jgi:hypothetical protein